MPNEKNHHGDFADWRLSIKPGDIVTVRVDSDNELEYEVKYAPWALGHGMMVVGLNGIAGGYLLSRVVRIVRRGE